MQVIQTTTLKRQTKKLHFNQKRNLDRVVNQILLSPNIGELKKGDLNGVRTFKFQMIDQLILIVYEISHDRTELVLLTLGTRENFYRDLKS